MIRPDGKAYPPEQWSRVSLKWVHIKRKPLRFLFHFVFPCRGRFFQFRGPHFQERSGRHLPDTLLPDCQKPLPAFLFFYGEYHAPCRTHRAACCPPRKVLLLTVLLCGSNRSRNVSHLNSGRTGFRHLSACFSR